jgi:lipopolysaccharide transport system permease protein
VRHDPGFDGPGDDVVIIDPRQSQWRAGLAALWRGRELLTFLAWRDIRVRYRQTLLGGLWALAEPLAGVLVFTLLFNRLAGLDSGEVPYPLYCFFGLLVWTFFSRGLRATSLSLVANSGLLTKAYFPRLALPLAGQLATVLDLACGLLAGVALLAWYKVCPGPAVLTLPCWLVLAGLNSLGIGLVLSAVNVRFRDVSQAIPFLTQVWLFATPVAYPLTAVPARWHAVYTLNPMVGVVEGMRWAVLPGYAFDPRLLVPTLTVGLGLLAFGLVWFHRAERRFADVV